MVAIILMLIVAVAAFYLVAMLAMVVTDKRTDIAILRTLGASPRQVMAVFLIQGSVIAWFGVALGVLLGSVDRATTPAPWPRSSSGCSASRSSTPTVYVRHAPALGAARRPDPVDRRHRHADHAARDYLPGAARLARAAGRRAALRVAMSNCPTSGLIGTRYLRSTHRSGFVSFVAFMSVLGLALGVAVLIVVLSVLNGFERELRSRMLAVTSHATITGIDGVIPDWRSKRRPRRRRSPA